MHRSAARPIVHVALAALIGVAAMGGLPRSQAIAAAAGPTVVELFQSQGCSSCPPTAANVNAIVDRPGVLALSFQVTYWDYLGWKDTFASPKFTARQQDYAHGLHHDGVYTPQVVIDGRRDLIGNDRGELDRAIRTSAQPAAADLTLEGGAVSIGQGAAPSGGADVWLVRYDPRVLQVPIQRGENNGKTLPHRNVVRELVRLGRWTGAAEHLPAPAAKDPALKTAVLVQAPGGGPILAAAKL
jgi:hypothetical protein